MEATRTHDIPAAAEPEPARRPATDAAEVLGRVVGRALAPLAALGARLRGGRVLHPAGTVCAAEVIAAADDPHLQPLAHRLAGAAVVRMSGALWRDPGPPELLGCALRFRGERPLSPDVAPEDQDLLFATTPSLWLVLAATFRTHRGDYLHNAYYTAGKLEVDGLGPVEFRLVPHPTAVQTGATRAERLDVAMEAGAARLRLDLRRERRAWQPLCDIRLRGRLVLDEDRLCYSPFHAGQDLRPRGFLAALRASVYAAGQAARTPT
jgi:hypothetical protein